MEQNKPALDVVRDVETHQGPKNTAPWGTPTGKPAEQPRTPEESADVAKEE